MNYDLNCHCEKPHCVCVVSVSTQDQGELKVDMNFADETVRIDGIERMDQRCVVHSLMLHCSVEEAIKKCKKDGEEETKRPLLHKSVNDVKPRPGEGERSYKLTYASKQPTLAFVMRICKNIDEFFKNEILNNVNKTMVFICCERNDMIREAANEVINEPLN